MARSFPRGREKEQEFVCCGMVFTRVRALVVIYYVIMTLDWSTFDLLHFLETSESVRECLRLPPLNLLVPLPLVPRESVVSLASERESREREKWRAMPVSRAVTVLRMVMKMAPGRGGVGIS